MGTGPRSSGIFYYKHTGAVGTFPHELRRGLFARVDPGYTGLFFGLLLVVSLTVWLLSVRGLKEETFSAQEIQKIQERYAQLMVNQPKPEAIPEVKIERKMPEVEGNVGGGGGGGKGGGKVNREKESYVEREARRQAGSGSRAEERAAVDREVEGSGIFAAITANGASGGKEGVDDLLGSAGVGLADVGSMKFSRGSFASARSGGGGGGGGGGNGTGDGDGFGERTGGRVGNVGIEKQQLGRAHGAQVATVATVNLSSAAPPEITGDGAGLEARSQEAIGRIEKREEPRLKHVFEEWLKRDPLLSGNLSIKFTILADGSVSNVVIVKSTIDNKEFSEAIVRYIARWQFAPAQGSGPVEVTYPFVFEGHS
jgi:TonB family protein